MVTTRSSRSQEIRSKVGHPIIDADGHTLELTPVLSDYVYQQGGADARDRFEEMMQGASEAGSGGGTTNSNWFSMTPEERKQNWEPATPWWFAPTTNVLDRATATLPKVLNERMDELGMDYAVLYTTLGLGFDRIQGQEQRFIVCRAMNACVADLYKEYSHRMTPAAIVPMDTPEIAIREMEYAINDLGLKTIMLPGRVNRPIPKHLQEHPEAEGIARYIDVIGLDSEYDYDPFWARCQEMGITPASHGSDFFWGAVSTSKYMFNHLSAFAHGHDTFAKALFLGGVTKRFPGLNFIFLEGGVAWACNLFSDLIGHWEKRNRNEIGRLDPRHLDQELILDLVREYGEEIMQSKIDEIRQMYATRDPHPAELDDWSNVPMENIEEMLDLFIEPYYFGCEADDPMNAWAFNTKVNPMGARLKAVFSSDIGHWDVPDMREVVEEAYELVEHELISEEDFRDFMFTNSVNLYGKVDPTFFDGTAVEAEARKLLGR